jgi:putative hydrolase of the HAD superfamily
MKHSICAVFDIDDTLYLERDYVHSGFEAAGRWAAKWIPIGDFAEQCWRRFAAGQRGSIFDEVLRESGRKANPELVSALVEVYRTHTPSIALATDAADALDAISHVASIAAISDGPAASQSRKAEALGLSAFAAPIILTEVLGSEFCKPHPRAFQQIQDSRPASAYLYIADNPLKDFAAPKQLGWATVRVRRPQGLHYMMENLQTIPDWEMGDCSGLPKLFAKL